MALLLLSGLLAGTAAAEESGFSLSLPQEVKGYTHCEITVQAPAAGEMLLTLYDSLDNPWLYRQESLSDGETVLSWDGRGAGGELLMSGPYRMVAEFFAADGRDFTASASFSVRGYASALALACTWTRGKTGLWNAGCRRIALLPWISWTGPVTKSIPKASP